VTEHEATVVHHPRGDMWMVAGSTTMHTTLSCPYLLSILVPHTLACINPNDFAQSFEMATRDRAAAFVRLLTTSPRNVADIPPGSRDHYVKTLLQCWSGLCSLPVEVFFKTATHNKLLMCQSEAYLRKVFCNAVSCHWCASDKQQ
jgi:hypothetical protein